MIYTPRTVIDSLECQVHSALATGREMTNPCVCTKIEFLGFEISISMDSSHGPGDLARSDIRVYTNPGSVPGVECTSEFLADGESMLYGDAETLLRVMKKIESMNRAERTVFGQ